MNNEIILQVDGKHEHIAPRYNKRGTKTLEDTVEKLSNWESVFDATGVPGKDSQNLRNNIKKRFSKILG